MKHTVRSRTCEVQHLRWLDRIGSCSGVLAATLLTAAIGSCSPSKPASFVSPAPDKIALYEGLPHQGYEAEKYAEERKKPIVEMGGFPFYRDALNLKEADARTLGAILADPGTFLPFKGEKKCGGFHPDYAIVAVAKGEETTYLICFGCGEANVYRPDRSETRFDLGHAETKPQLSAILKPYHKNRPGPIKGP